MPSNLITKQTDPQVPLSNNFQLIRILQCMREKWCNVSNIKSQSSKNDFV